VQIHGRRALITGATGGLGQAIARGLAARGAQLLLTGRRADALEPLCRGTGGRAIISDLADRSTLPRVAREAAAADILVLNAALPASGVLLDYSDAQIDRALDVNLRAPILLARHVGEAMAQRGCGHIVFVSSLSAKAAAGGSAIYCATKFGLRGFALSLREDLQPHGVGVSIVAPGFIRDAGMFAASGVKLPWFAGTKRPQDVADAVVRAIEHDRAEITVAPLSVRIGASLSSVAPAPVMAIQRRMGGARVAADLAAAQRDLR
jgi:short-subunit dehydrogenase